MELTEILTQISITVTVCFAFYGIDSWRREHTGKRKIELAEDSLALFYEAADAIKHLRHPISLKSETEPIERRKYENDQEFKARENASVVFTRYKEHHELFNKLHAMRYRFMAQFGKKKAMPFDDIRNIVNEIIGSARILTRLWPRDNFNSDIDRENNRKNIEKYESIFWEGLEEDDPINPKVNHIISEIEETCRDVISGKGTLHGWLNVKLGKH